MDRPPLPDPVARCARSYLAALVPSTQVSDAWHELLADVAYWGDRQELPVLRLAHQVVLQHERVTDEVAVLVLDELGIASPPSVAEVLDVTTSHAATLLDRVAATVAEEDRPGDVHVFDAEVGEVGTRAAGHEDAPSEDTPDDETPDDETPDDEASAEDTPPDDAPAVAVLTDEPSSAEDRPAAPDDEGATAVADRPAESHAVRIGFEDDDVIEVGDWNDPTTGLDARRWLAVVVVAAFLLWALLG